MNMGFGIHYSKGQIAVAEHCLAISCAHCQWEKGFPCYIAKSSLNVAQHQCHQSRESIGLPLVLTINHKDTLNKEKSQKLIPFLSVNYFLSKSKANDMARFLTDVYRLEYKTI